MNRLALQQLADVREKLFPSFYFLVAAYDRREIAVC